MANMSYCRWHNTRIDVNDCFESFWDGRELSEEEYRCAKWMIKDICEFLVDTGVIEDYDCTELFMQLDELLEFDELLKNQLDCQSILFRLSKYFRAANCRSFCLCRDYEDERFSQYTAINMVLYVHQKREKLLNGRKENEEVHSY